MLESNLIAGSQMLVAGQPLTHGQSITDACMGWDETAALLNELAVAVRVGRR
jgi:3-deoxy-7-phosphoheptulonate synthase